jgi:AraC-like DNA-binding protein
MRGDCQQTLTLNELAAVAHLSPSRFSHLFKATVGCSPAWWLKQLRLAEARRLLETTTVSVKQVLQATGFRDRSHFCRSFHAMYGCTPCELRRAVVEHAYVQHASEASRLGGGVATKKCQLRRDSFSVTTVELTPEEWDAVLTVELSQTPGAQAPNTWSRPSGNITRPNRHASMR